MLEQAGDVVETWGLRMGGGQLACGGGSEEASSNGVAGCKKLGTWLFARLFRP